MKLAIYKLFRAVLAGVEFLLTCRAFKKRVRADEPSGSLPVPTWKKIDWEVIPYQWCDMNQYGFDEPVDTSAKPHQPSLDSFLRVRNARVKCRAESLGSSQPLCPSSLRHSCQAVQKGLVIK